MYTNDSSLREDKSAGADDMSLRLLKYISNEIVQPLTYVEIWFLVWTGVGSSVEIGTGRSGGNF